MQAYPRDNGLLSERAAGEQGAYGGSAGRMNYCSIPQRPVGNEQRVTQARLCSPGRLNGSGGWKMEVLREIREDPEPSPDAPVLVFSVEDGGRHVDSKQRTDLTMRRDLARIYLQHSQIGSRPMGISGGRRG